MAKRKFDNWIPIVIIVLLALVALRFIFEITSFLVKIAFFLLAAYLIYRIFFDKKRKRRR